MSATIRLPHWRTELILLVRCSCYFDNQHHQSPTAALRFLNERIALTPDLGGTATTQQVGNAVVNLLQS